MPKKNQNRSGDNSLPSSGPQGVIRPRGTLFDTLTQPRPKKWSHEASAVRSSGFHCSRAHLRPVKKQPSPEVKSNQCIPTPERAGKSQLLTVEILQQHMQNNTLKEVIDAAVGAHSDSHPSDPEAHSKLKSEFT